MAPHADAVGVGYLLRLHGRHAVQDVDGIGRCTVAAPGFSFRAAVAAVSERKRM
jgi:hypothetical protein